MRLPAILAALLLTALATAAPKPNILFILTEDQGAQAGFLGTPGILTPQMDRLAKSGRVFPNAFVVYPVCSASKAQTS
jgi:N-sulfoglucosamine sulfohydrolase